MVSHLLGRYATDAVIAMTNENIENFQQGFLTKSVSPEKVWDLILGGGGMYNQQTIYGFFVERIDSSVYRAMLQW